MKGEANTGIIFNTQKFSIHDGVGIRTLIFMKGCPLKCVWCSNPESQAREVEIMDVKSNCVGCGKCAELCPVKGIEKESYSINRVACTKCGTCAKYCYANAKKLTGKEMSLVEVMKIIEKDRIFYHNSGGGVTVGGGEPTMQADFVAELLRSCRNSNIHTAIETCGYGKWEKIGKVFEYTDQIFYDLKVMNPEIHKKFTGVDNILILENAKRIAVMGKQIIFRIPLIPGCNDDRENIEATGNFVSGLMAGDNDISIEILPYHDFGSDKYKWLDAEYALKNTKKPAEELVQEYKMLLAERGCRVI